MIISLDYDGTYTAAPALWDAFVLAAVTDGHEVVCITMRKPSEPIEMPCPVIYTSRAAKVPFAKLHGLDIDVWIDDSPHWLFADG